VHVYLHLLSRVCLHTYDSAGTPSNTENTPMYQALVGTQGPCGLRNALENMQILGVYLST
jgi:hypothetical protein